MRKSPGHKNVPDRASLSGVAGNRTHLGVLVSEPNRRGARNDMDCDSPELPSMDTKCAQNVPSSHDAAAGVMADWMYEQLTEKYVLDPKNHKL